MDLKQVKVVKVFSATMARQRVALGDTVTQYLKDNPKLVVLDKEVHQSGDASFHCLTIVLWMGSR